MLKYAEFFSAQMKLRVMLLWSALMMAVFRCFGSVLMAYPNTHDHREGDAVAPELKELLADNAPPANQRESVAPCHASPPKLSAERLII